MSKLPKHGALVRASTSGANSYRGHSTFRNIHPRHHSQIGQSSHNATSSTSLATPDTTISGDSGATDAPLSDSEINSMASYHAVANLPPIRFDAPLLLSPSPFFFNANNFNIRSTSFTTIERPQIRLISTSPYSPIQLQSHSVPSTNVDEAILTPKPRRKGKSNDSNSIPSRSPLNGKGKDRRRDLSNQEQRPFNGPKADVSQNSFFNDNSSFTDDIGAFPETSPSHSPSPSPGPYSSKKKEDVGHRSPFPDVNGPKAKFAVTTSAESGLSSSSSGDGSGSKAAKLQYVASTSSASAQTGSANSLPPQASSSSGSTDPWAKKYGLPRSTKDHEYMFEHGAYGIPKRHPLSAVRSASSTSKQNKSERLAPSRDVVPVGKIHAAADMFSALFASSQSPPSSAKGEFQPYRGDDALHAALAGGSTAEGYEIQPNLDHSANAAKSAKTKAHRMAIRGPDGRIIKERLRSVQVGEDAYFLRPDALGVADGVGGWASRPGADPALFSRLLMHFCAVELSRYDGLSAPELAADNGSLLKAWASVDAVEVMHRAWERCVRASRREGILGSSTALIGILRGEELRIANMGDCVLMIIRGGEMLFRSTEQQHSFNFPVQLGMMGDTTDTIKKHVMASQSKERAAGEGEVASGTMEDYDAVEDVTVGEANSSENAKNGRNRTDTAPPVTPDKQIENENEPEWDEPRRDAGRWTVRVKAGDIIVVGSDGLMDNLFDEDIIEEVLRFLPPGVNSENGEKEPVKIDTSNFSPQMVSEALCSRAKAVSEDSRAVSSPFQQRAMEEGLNYVGGKHDDISVLVCLVGERDGLVLDSSGGESSGQVEEGEKKENDQSESTKSSL